MLIHRPARLAALAAACSFVAGASAQQTIDVADAFGITPASTAAETDAAIRAAFDQAGVGDTVLLNDFGGDWVIGETLFLKSDTTLRLGTGAVVQAADNDFFRANDRALIRAAPGRENLIVESDGTGTIRGIADVIRGLDSAGEDYQGQGDYGFGGHGLQFSSSTNVTVRDINLTNHGGDGLHFIGARPEFTDQNWVENAVVERVVSTDNRRQGFSLDSGRNVVVRDNLFAATRGENPSAGMDLEPTFAFERLENILIEDNLIIGNRNDGLKFALSNQDEDSAPIDVVARGNWIEGNGAAGISVGQFRLGDPEQQISGRILIEDTVVARSGLVDTTESQNPNVGAVEITQNPGPSAKPGDGELEIVFSRLSIVDTAEARPGARFGPIGLTSFAGEAAPDSVGNVTFDDLAVLDAFDRPFFDTRLVAGQALLEDITIDGVVGSPAGDATVLEGRGQEDVVIDVVTLASLSGDLIVGDDAQPLALDGDTQYALLATADVNELGDTGSVGVAFRDDFGEVVFETSIDFRNLDELEVMKVFTSPAGFASAELFVDGPGGFDPTGVRLFAVRAIPEPATAGLLALAAVPLVRRRR